MFIRKGHSLMVEQWSSKSHAWVRFLLSLITQLFPHRKNFKTFPNKGRSYNPRFRRFRARVSNVLFRTFAKRTPNNISIKRKRRRQLFFYFNRSHFHNQISSQFPIRFEAVSDSVFWLKAQYINNNLFKTAVFIHSNFYFHLRHLLFEFKFLFAAYLQNVDSLLYFWRPSVSVDSKRRHLGFFLKNSFWLLKSTTRYKSSGFNNLLVPDLHIKDVLTTSRLVSFSPNSTKNKVRTSTQPEHLGVSTRAPFRRKNFWSYFTSLKKFNEITTPIETKVHRFLPYLYAMSWVKFPRLFIRQKRSWDRRKKLYIPYFYIFDTYTFDEIELLTIDSSLKNWNGTEIPTILIDKMFYILFNTGRWLSLKNPINSVFLTRRINNAPFENKFSRTVKWSFKKIKSFTRLKRFDLSKKLIFRKKKKSFLVCS